MMLVERFYDLDDDLKAAPLAVVLHESVLNLKWNKSWSICVKLEASHNVFIAEDGFIYEDLYMKTY